LTVNTRSLLWKAMVVRVALVSLRVALILGVTLSLAACTKKRGEAIVLEKEHIDVAEVTPSPSPEPTPTTTTTTTEPQASSSPSNDEPVLREMAPDEIEVDGYVMKKEVRGTSKDPRAGKDEKWLVKVEVVENGRRINVHSDRAHYEKVNVRDRIKVRYKEGNYTGTVWSAEIVD
jgi:hypothetical protein